MTTQPRGALEAAFAAVSNDESIMKMLRAAFLPHNRKAYDELTFERVPEFVPQASYTVPIIEVNRFVSLIVEAIKQELGSALLSAGAEGECCIPDAGEPKFVLLGRDPQAPDLVERWADDRQIAEPDSDKIARARAIATDMRAFKTANPDKGMRSELYTRPAPSAGVGPSAEATAALRFVYDHFCRMDNGDEPLEKYPQRAIDALAGAGWAVVPCGLPFAVLGEAAQTGMLETGNPKHIWEWLIAKTRIYPFCAPDASIEVPGRVDTRALSHALNCLGVDAKTNTPDFELAEQLAAQMRSYRGESTPPASAARE